MKNGKKRLFLRLFVHHRARLGVSSIISYYVNFSVALAEAVDMTKGIIRRCIYAVYSTDPRAGAPKFNIVFMGPVIAVQYIKTPIRAVFLLEPLAVLVSICRRSL